MYSTGIVLLAMAAGFFFGMMLGMLHSMLTTCELKAKIKLCKEKHGRYRLEETRA